ncbi:hypothetical protein [Bizionia arctica]|uniref:Uncharacterized protein n=1 Tax=Bizionia arctica TaxID=1495645 RepID=A0A917GHN5_9FLAO|nr:hypothetical protein [Bizionia arctica]GGG46790.1 hypothetical protein GCM10010976_17790 [Bizionia arctica]
MDNSLKIVSKIPIIELWSAEELIEAKRERYLTKDELTEILKKYPVEFVIASLGENLKWIPVNKCFENWRSKIKDHVTNKNDRINLEEFPKEFAYIASEWSGNIQTPIILLEKYH